MKSISHSENCKEVQIGGCLICFLMFMFGSYETAFFRKHVYKAILSLMKPGVPEKCALGK